MKKIIISALMLIAISTSAFSTPKDDVRQQVRASFTKSYNNAKEIKWEVQKDFTKVTFELDGQIFFAYYNAEGEQLAVTRNIRPAQLPMNLAASLRDKLKDNWLTELFEVSSDGVTSYFATLNNSTHQVILKADGTAGWVTFKKDKRDGQ